LLPAVQAAREAARRATCYNNQHQLSLAALAFEATQRRFPGYANDLGADSNGTRINASWVVSLLPHLESNALYQRWKDPTVPFAGKPIVFLQFGICPSDPPETSTVGSADFAYVVNSGIIDTASEGPAHGVFFNRMLNASMQPTQNVNMSLDYISQHDGSPNTLLLSENVQSYRWAAGRAPVEADLCMVWYQTAPPACAPINRCVDLTPALPDINYARPSSRHGGGVVASFCDGHQEWLREDIDYTVFRHLMTPDSALSGITTVYDRGSW